jgi:hypothetical protein
MTTKITRPDIHDRFVEALSESVTEKPDLDQFPLELQLTPPLPPKLRVYAYRVTTPPGSEPEEKHVARLIVPGQAQGERASFNHSDGYFVLLLGYAPESEVFILWDGGLHRDFAYSKPVKVGPGPVFKAVAGDIGTQKRHLNRGTETVLTANETNLPEAIEKRVDLTTERLTS